MVEVPLLISLMMICRSRGLYMGYDYETILDEVDKLSLQGLVEEAKELVRELVPPLFAVDFTNLMELIERNTYKL